MKTCDLLVVQGNCFHFSVLLIEDIHQNSEIFFPKCFCEEHRVLSLYGRRMLFDICTPVLYFQFTLHYTVNCLQL